MIESNTAKTFPPYTEPALRATEETAQRIKESVWRGSNPKIDTAKCYLLLAAMNVCEDSLKTFAHCASHPEPEDVEYLALDGKRSAAQVLRILEVMADLDHLTDQ